METNDRCLQSGVWSEISFAVIGPCVQ